MKKHIAISLLLLSCAFGTVQAQNAAVQLNNYISHKTDAAAQQEIDQETLETDTNLSTKDIQAAVDEVCSLPDPVSDVKEYVTDNAQFTATGKLNAWEKKRAELYRYVQGSNWHTWKNISDGDRRFVETLKTICFGLIKETAAACGYDRIIDRLEQKAINEYENNQEVQNAVQAVLSDISDAANNEKHTADAMYVQVQHNAFILLLMNYVDYKKLVAQYPEVDFLFDDLYTFFKWRADLRTYDPAYKLNENNINVAFRHAVSTNSFFGWWELTNIAKMEMRNAVESGSHRLNTQTISDERDGMKSFEAYAKRARYFGRLWNGMQRYAVQKKILPKVRNPKRGAGRVSIREAIKDSFAPLTNEQVLSTLTDIRHHYITERTRAEKVWQKWYQDNLASRQQQASLEIQRSLGTMVEEVKSDTVK